MLRVVPSAETKTLHLSTIRALGWRASRWWSSRRKEMVITLPKGARAIHVFPVRSAQSTDAPINSLQSREKFEWLKQETNPVFGKSSAAIREQIPESFPGAVK